MLYIIKGVLKLMLYILFFLYFLFSVLPLECFLGGKILRWLCFDVIINRKVNNTIIIPSYVHQMTDGQYDIENLNHQHFSSSTISMWRRDLSSVDSEVVTAHARFLQGNICLFETLLMKHCHITDGLHVTQSLAWKLAHPWHHALTNRCCPGFHSVKVPCSETDIFCLSPLWVYISHLINFSFCDV